MTVGPRLNLSSAFGQLPLRAWGLVHCPAIPFWADASGDPDLQHVLDTVARLEERGGVDAAAAYKGLSTEYTIAGRQGSAEEFLYGGDPANPADPRTRLPLHRPEQFTLPWTTYRGMYADSEDLSAVFSRWVDVADPAEATKNFWPTIADYGIPYNLLVLEKVRPERRDALLAEYGAGGDDLPEGSLYEIDMSILASLEPFTIVHPQAPREEVRFVPGTRTLLVQDPETKDLKPVQILVLTEDGRSRQVYTPDKAAWIYALQAAKASVTVWGIWLGHVYPWHLVTSAMIMTMTTELGSQHRLWPLIEPQGQSVIDFDFVLLMFLWSKIVPPTPVGDYMTLLRLCERYAAGRSFFDDDPLATLASKGIEKADFSKDADWDKYPTAGFLSAIYANTADYVEAVVGELYASDAEVVGDTRLKAWIAASGDPLGGNVRGLPDVRTRADLTKVVTSLLHRVNAHGAGALAPTVHPALSFMANFPPCLQRAEIPAPSRVFSKPELLEFLPRTGTLGQMTTFYFTFAYSPPYFPLIPSGGINLRPQFPPGQAACNEALYRFRGRMRTFIDDYVAAWNDELAKLRGTPGPLPAYAEQQYQQWSRSIEI